MKTNISPASNPGSFKLESLHDSARFFEQKNKSNSPVISKRKRTKTKKV